MRLPEEAHLIHGECRKLVAIGISRRHAQRMKIIARRHRDALAQAFHAVVIHQKPDRSPVHAVDASAGIHGLVEDLQHEAVAAERNDHLGFLERRVAVSRFQLLHRHLRLF